MKGYPRWFLPILLMSLFSESMTGLLLIPTTLDMKFQVDVPWRLMGEIQLDTLVIHSISAYLLMLMVGALFTIHMRAGWRKRKHLKSGLSLVCLFSGLILSALGLLYFGDEHFSLLSSSVHIGAGVLVIFFFMLHYYLHYRDKHNPEVNQVRP